MKLSILFVYTTILLLTACAKSSASDQGVQAKGFDSVWHSDDPWTNVVFETEPAGNERAVYTQAQGTICQYDMAKTDTQIVLSNPVTILQRLGDADCNLYTGTWEYTFSPGHLEMVEDGRLGVDWEVFE